MMSSQKLWNLLLVQRSPFPLFIRIAPRAHRPGGGSIWQLLMWYTLFGLYLSTIAAPFMFRSILMGILLVIFGSPAFIVVLIAFVGAPFVLFGGIFIGLRLADTISRELTFLRQSGFGDLLRATPDGAWGLIRAVSAAQLRQRNWFFGAGIYEMIKAHATLSLGLGIPLGSIATLWSLDAFPPVTETVATGIPFLLTLYTAFITLPVLLSALLHADFRQSLMFGVTAGILGGEMNRTGGETITLTTMLLGTLASTSVIASIAALAARLSPPSHERQIIFAATLVGWGLSLLLREHIIRYLWRTIINLDDNLTPIPS